MTRLKIMESLSGRVKKISEQIFSTHLKNRLIIISDLLENMVDIDKEITDLINGKLSNIDHSEVLKNLYDRSADILGVGNQALFQMDIALKEKDKDVLSIQKKFIEIRDRIIKTIVKLDTYHKLHLNPKFHSHGLTAFEINQRMNELRELIRKMNGIKTVG